MAIPCAGTGSRSLAEKPVLQKPVIVAPGLMRPMLEPMLPLDRVEVRWFADVDEAIALAPLADIGWLDILRLEDDPRPVLAAKKAKWLHTTLAGLSKIPVGFARERGVIVTKGTGLTSKAVADYGLMGVLMLAKRVDEVVRAQDRREWLPQPPCNDDLDGAKALIIGYGAIGSQLGERLKACGMMVTGVRRQADPAQGMIGAEDWRTRLGEYDYVILAAPETPETYHMIGTAEFDAMKTGARFVNIARGSMVDQDALIAALKGGRLRSAFVDVADPEPLPADHPLWAAPNIIITMHMSGRGNLPMYVQAAKRFADNVHRYLAGEPLEAVADLERGY
ncbi:MAG: D-2-hydroxyacid dehydrogenase [Sphingobium sp.]|nr:D-2-hydroxyacid dehydrogenase [Sphingobium sp.]